MTEHRITEHRIVEQSLDEDALVIPHLWRHYLHPWRGNANTRIEPGAEKVVLDLFARDDAIAALLLGEHGDPELAQSARRYRGGRPDPVGAAAVASVSPLHAQRAYADFWTAEHGIAFAACALVETVGMRTVEVRGRSQLYDGVVVHHDAVHRGDRGAAAFRHKHWEGARRCRALLATADDGDYADTVRQLASHRQTTAGRRLVSYLVPTRQDWVTECCTDSLNGGTVHTTVMNRRLLFSSLARPEQLDTPAVLDGFALGQLDPSLLATMVDGLGRDVLACFLARVHDPRSTGTDRGHLYEAIAVLPIDEAFQALMADDEHARPALRTAMERFPKRALRLLAEAESPLLNEHVTAHAELIVAVLPDLPGRMRAAVQPILPPVPAHPGSRLLLGPLRERPPARGIAGLRAPIVEADADTALAMGAALATGTAQGVVAGEWLDGQGTAVVPLLVPAAFGGEPEPRRAAEQALAYLRCRYGLDAVVRAANAHGAEAAEAVEALLAEHPVETGLVRPPEIGDWLLDNVLPRVLWRDGERPLPPGATRRLAGLLALPPAFAMDALRQALDPASLAEFGWQLFTAWERPRWDQANAVWVFRPLAEDGWALTRLAHIGDDETARRLVPVIRGWRKWRDENAEERAIKALDVLAGIGTEIALMHLHGIALDPGLKELATHADARIGEIAARRGLTAGQLDDRLVPDFGFDVDGGRLALDYGRRRFLVGFDESFEPVVLDLDQDGAPRRSLPRPRANDDLDRAGAANATFTQLKADLRTVVGNQSRRLRRAMTTGRRWTHADFDAFIVHQPVTGRIARRLLWTSEHKGMSTAFRIAEDRTLADLHDNAITLHPSAHIGVANPSLLDEATRRAWTQLFLDYEIAQPFPQLQAR
ncbi:DUF4132 domain-containing protein [Actinomadura sp. 9N215]|uniref:DUF4132 domain-containing protein n=1 Tax=Actinomadura sp. 9N215 TaxID=3375150 RepID=UPI00379019B8